MLQRRHHRLPDPAGQLELTTTAVFPPYLAETSDTCGRVSDMADLTDAVQAMCAFCELRATTRRIPTPDGGERWEIRAVSVTGFESWRVEADELIDAVCLLAESLGLDL